MEPYGDTKSDANTLPDNVLNEKNLKTHNQNQVEITNGVNNETKSVSMVSSNSEEFVVSSASKGPIRYRLSPRSSLACKMQGIKPQEVL